MQKSFTWQDKREERDGGEWLIETHTQNKPYISIVTTQHKTRQKRVSLY